MAALLGALAALATAGMNVYTFVVTGKQTQQLITTVETQATQVKAANDQLAAALKSNQETVDKLIDVADRIIDRALP